MANTTSTYSKSEIYRLVKQGAVRVNGKKVTDPNFITKVGDTIRVGKGRFFKIVQKKDDKSG